MRYRTFHFILLVVGIFLAGWVVGGVTSVATEQINIPLGSPEQLSPGNHISDKQIGVYKETVILDIPNAHWAEFADTNSMDPLIDSGANSIEIQPSSSSQIKVGDIVSYESPVLGGLIVHRVVETGIDSKGWYARAKGDNNLFKDPEKIRFDQVKGIVVAIIY